MVKQSLSRPLNGRHPHILLWAAVEDLAPVWSTAFAPLLGTLSWTLGEKITVPTCSVTAVGTFAQLSAFA
jgi:hypothetical protein